MSEIIMIRTPSGLVPADRHQWDELAEDRIKVGDECRCAITKPRNLKFHRKYMAMINATFEMQDSFTSLSHWREAVLIAAGHCESFINHEGKVNYIAKSISFARCDETEFLRVYNNTIQAICSHWIHDEPESIRVILEYC